MVEALVALLVMAFGMLAIAGFQISMSRNSDISRQRAEAVRIGQREVERLRSIETVVSDAGKFDYVNDLVGGSRTVDSVQVSASDQVTTNTSYTVNWAVTRADGTAATATNSGNDPEKWINVSVSWTDRSGGSQIVRLRSVVSRSDPIDLGTLATGPGGTKTRTPKNRNVNIPYPAVDLGNGKSGFTPPGLTGSFYVFDNNSGDVLQQCTGSIASYATASCTTKNAYLLSGYIRFLFSNPSGNETAQDTAVSQAQDGPWALTAQVVDYVNPSGGSIPTNPPVCYTQQQKILRYSNPPSATVASASANGATVTLNTGGGNNGFSIGQMVVVSGTDNSTFDGQYTLTGATNGSVSFASTRTGTTSNGKVSLLQDLTVDYNTSSSLYPGYSIYDKYVAYTCVIEYYNSGSIQKSWWGRFVIIPQITSPATSAWGLASSGSNANSCDTTPTSSCNYKVCRFTGDYVSDDVVSNSEHPLYYRAVNYTLDNQNYLIVNPNQSCPTDGEVDTPNKNYVNRNTIVHQTTTTTTGGSGGSLSTGSQWSAAGQEPATTTTTIRMLDSTQ